MKALLSPSRIAAVSLFACILTVAGCQRPVGSVSGKVVYKDKALKGGTVSFVSTEGRQSFATEIKEDGTYSIDRITGGTYKVCVDTSHLKPPSSGPTKSGGSGGKGFVPPGMKQDDKNIKSAPPPDAVLPEGYKGSSPADAAIASNAKKYIEIPESYKDETKTDLNFTIVGGANTFDINLK